MKRITVITLIATSLLSITAAHATDFAAVEMARQKCLSAPSAQKAKLCYQYKQMKASQSGSSSSSSSQDLTDAKRNCENSPWYKKPSVCYKYHQLRQRIENEKKKKQLEKDAKKAESQAETLSVKKPEAAKLTIKK